MLPPAAALILLACCGARLSAQDGPRVQLTAIDGRAAQGLLTVAANGSVSVHPDEGQPLQLNMADVLSIEMTGNAAPAAAAKFVWLRSGCQFPATRIDGKAASGSVGLVSFTTPGGADFDLPMTAIAAMRCRETEPQTFAVDSAEPDPNLDFLFVVKDGEPQRFSVTVTSIHDGKVHFDLRGTRYDFPLTGADSAAAIVFGRNTGFAPNRQGKPRSLVALTTGERFEGKLLQVDSQMRLRLDEGVEVLVPSSTIARIDVLSDKMTWIGSLVPKVEQTPAFDRPWPWTVDRSPAGAGILLGGKTYQRGVVLVPRTKLIYDLGGKYDYFEAVVGIEDRGGPQAHAVFRVLADGKVLFESEPMTLRQTPKQIRLELGKCKQLAIEADFGKNFDLGDFCAFAEARIVQQ